MRVEASAANLIVSPETSTEPVNRLHDAFPAALRVSGNARVAFTFANAGVPARSCSTHSVPVSVSGAEFGLDGFPAGLRLEEHAVARSADNTIPTINSSAFKLLPPPQDVRFSGD